MSLVAQVTAPLRALLRSPLAAAIAAPHGVDAYLGALSPRWVVHEVRATIEDVVVETPTTATLVLHPSASFRGHRAGQHVRVGVTIEGVRHTRCYSISSAPSRHRRGDGRVTLTVRAAEGGLVSRHLVRHAAAGDVLALSQAEGDFVLPEPLPARLVFLSGGSGITPVMSMLRAALERPTTQGAAREIAFVHYARSADEVIFARELEALSAAHGPRGLRVLRVIERGGGGDLEGRFDTEHLDAAMADWQSATSFLCGPAPMMRAVRAAYATRGAAGRLHEERFTAEAPAPTTDRGEVTFARSRVVAPCAGRSLLVVAEEAGLRPESGCRRGVCHGCTRRKLRGAVRDLRTGAVSDRPDEPIQLCVSTAIADVAIDL
jgi:ferredoxin-NADP reductase